MVFVQDCSRAAAPLVIFFLRMKNTHKLNKSDMDFAFMVGIAFGMAFVVTPVLMTIVFVNL